MIRTVFSRKSIYWFMIALTGGAIIFSGLPGLIKALMNTGNTIGTVNGQPIALYEYRTELAKEQRLLALYRDQFGPNYRKILSYLGKSENSEQGAQEQIITSKLLLAMAYSIPVYLHPAYITRELAQPRTIYSILGEAIPSYYLFTEQGVLKLNQLQLFLKSQGLTMEQFESMAESLLTSQWGLKLAYGSVVVSKSSQELFERLHFYTRAFKLETVDLLPLIKEERAKPVSEEELRSFYEKNRSSSAYWSAERRSGNIWSFELSKFSPEGEKSEKSQKDLEALQRQHFMDSAQQLIFLGDEKAFQQFNSSYQAHHSTLVKLLKPQMDEKNADALISALFSVGAVGDRTVITKGSTGYIVEVTEVIAPRRLDFEVVRDTVADNLYLSRARAQAFEILHGSAGPRITTQGFTIAPDTKTAPAALEKADIPFSTLAGLLMPGHSTEGSNTRAVYRITLLNSELDVKKSTKGNKGERAKKLYEAAGDLALRNLIASLRNHAIIMIRTKSEIYN